jgi:WD40 repeat protein
MGMNTGSTRSGIKRASDTGLFLCLISAVIFLYGCSGASGLSATEVAVGQETSIVASQIPTAKVTMSPTETATPFVVIQEGEGIPATLEEISTKNAKKLQEIGNWGNGVAYAVEWSPDGKMIAISTSRYLLLVDVKSREITRRISFGFPLYQIDFSPDSSTIYGAGTMGKLVQYNIESDNWNTKQLGNVMPVTAVAVSHSGQYVLSADWQKKVQLWNLESGVLDSNFGNTLSGSEALGFSADDQRVYTWSPLEPIKVWPINNTAKVIEYYFGLDDNQRTGTTVRFSGDGNNAAVNQTRQMRVQNLIDGTTTGLMKDFSKDVVDLDLSADGQWLFSLHTDEVRIWQSAKSKVVSTFLLGDLAEQIPVMIRVSPDGSSFFLLGQDLILFAVDTESRGIEQGDAIRLNLATDLSFSSNLSEGNKIYQVGLDGAMYIADLENGEITRKFVSTDLQISAYTVSSNMLVTGYTNRTIELRDLDSLEVGNTLRGLSQIPLVLLLSEKQDILVAQTAQTTTGIWQVSSGAYQLKQEWKIPLDRLQFSWDEQYLIGSGNGQLQIYNVVDDFLSDAMDGRLLAVGEQGILLQPINGDGKLQVISPASLDVLQYLDILQTDRAAFSPDGSLLALSGSDLILMDMTNGEILLNIKNPARGAELYFSLDGNLLIFVFTDGSIRLYGIPS